MDLSGDSPELLRDTQVSPSPLLNSGSPPAGGKHAMAVAVGPGKGKGKGQGLKRLRRSKAVQQQQALGDKERKAARRAARAADLANAKRVAGRFFEEEASLSGSDSGDDEGHMGRRAGGVWRWRLAAAEWGLYQRRRLHPALPSPSATAFTQSAGKGSDSGGGDGGDGTARSKKRKRKRKEVPRDGMAMYFHVNQDLGTPFAKKATEGQRWEEGVEGGDDGGSGITFRGAENGLPNIERILQKQRRREERQQTRQEQEQEQGQEQGQGQGHGKPRARPGHQQDSQDGEDSFEYGQGAEELSLSQSQSQAMEQAAEAGGWTGRRRGSRAPSPTTAPHDQSQGFGPFSGPSTALSDIGPSKQLHSHRRDSSSSSSSSSSGHQLPLQVWV